jgi:hypothetical protein
VAAKTVDVATKLQKAEEAAVKAQKPRTSCGKNTRNSAGPRQYDSFSPAARLKNLDRMETIYYGVMDAFDYNGREAREARAEDTVAEAKVYRSAQTSGRPDDHAVRQV